MSSANGKSMLTITEAAEATGVDRPTIQRLLASGKFPNARKEGKGRGRWLIPSAELDAASPTGARRVGTGAPVQHISVEPDEPAEPAAPIEVQTSIGTHTSIERIEPVVVPVLSEVEVLRAQITALQIRAEVAEAEARERERVIAAKDDDLNSLRAILMGGTAAKLADPTPEAPAVAPGPGVAPPRTALNSLWSPEGLVQPEPEPPKRRWWQTSAPPPTTLDSFWLTDEPVEFEAPHRPWWRRWPGTRNRSGHRT
ncbi:MAG: helix-turn-helix domain-containing protein [Acidimicrobiales bacterium]|jgi:excisionase family DNA binding protein